MGGGDASGFVVGDGGDNYAGLLVMVAVVMMVLAAGEVMLAKTLTYLLSTVCLQKEPYC